MLDYLDERNKHGNPFVETEDADLTLGKGQTTF